MSSGIPIAAKPTPSGGTLGSVGSYQLVEKLPRRGEVAEYLARQTGPGGFERWCTLKMARRPSASSDARAAETVSREAKVMMRLDHPCIVRFHDFFEHGDRLVLVLEHFSGLTLERFVELSAKCGAKRDDRIAWSVALSLFDALAHAHGLVDQAGQPAPILHRDVRPANILLASDGRVRLTGFAFAQDVDADESTACAAVHTAPSYVAPEVVRAREATDRSDTFAAALVVWELLTGRSGTLEGLSDFELLKHLSIRALDPLRSARADLPALVTTALDQCLVLDPEQRRIGCGEVAGCIRAGLETGDGCAALRDAVAALGPAVEKLAGGKAATPPTSRLMTSEPAEVPPRPEAVTIPDAAQLDLIHEMPTALIQAPTLLSAPQPPQRANAPEPPEPPSGAQARVSVDPGGAAEQETSGKDAADPVEVPNDDDLAAMQASQARRRAIRIAVVGVPMAVTIAALAVAFGGAKCTGTTGPTSQPAQTVVAAAASPTAAPTQVTSEPAEPRVAPATSSVVPPKEAVLVVQGPPDGDVYVMGKSLGRTGMPLHTDCGQRYIRVGTPIGPGGMAAVRWLAEGRSVMLRCGEKTVIASDE